MRTRKLEAIKDNIQAAYKNGATLETLSMVHGVSVGTIRNILLRLGENIRKPGRPKEF